MVQGAGHLPSGAAGHRQLLGKAELPQWTVRGLPWDSALGGREGVLGWWLHCSAQGGDCLAFQHSQVPQLHQRKLRPCQAQVAQPPGGSQQPQKLN